MATGKRGAGSPEKLVVGSQHESKLEVMVAQKLLIKMCIYIQVDNNAFQVDLISIYNFLSVTNVLCKLFFQNTAEQNKRKGEIKFQHNRNYSHRCFVAYLIVLRKSKVGYLKYINIIAKICCYSMNDHLCFFTLHLSLWHYKFSYPCDKFVFNNLYLKICVWTPNFYCLNV